jgi:hypothetical protein
LILPCGFFRFSLFYVSTAHASLWTEAERPTETSSSVDKTKAHFLERADIDMTDAEAVGFLRDVNEE